MTRYAAPSEIIGNLTNMGLSSIIPPESVYLPDVLAAQVIFQIAFIFMNLVSYP